MSEKQGDKVLRVWGGGGNYSRQLTAIAVSGLRNIIATLRDNSLTGKLVWKRENLYIKNAYGYDDDFDLCLLR